MSAIKNMTKGKWVIFHELNVQSESERFVCACGRNSYEKDNWEQNTANAKVISEVPNLLKVLQNVRKDLRNAGPSDKEWMGKRLKEIENLFERLEQ